MGGAGVGIPTVGSAHEVAVTGSQVVYVDHDAVAHTRVLLADDPNTVVMEGPLGEPDLLLRWGRKASWQSIAEALRRRDRCRHLRVTR
jgi:hypothetical protein